MTFAICSLFKLPFYSSEERHLFFFFRKTFKTTPENISLYKTALIHSSYQFKLQNGTPINNERLEFLGDSILDAVVSCYLYSRFPDKDEGFLTNARSKIVNSETLNKIALNLGLEEKIKSRLYNDNSVNYLGNALEAIIGAMFLDKGFLHTKKNILKIIFNAHISIDELLIIETNYKSRLLEWSQKNKAEVRFESTKVSEEKNTPVFISNLYINNSISSTGKGTTKKEAEQEAAKTIFNKLHLQN